MFLIHCAETALVLFAVLPPDLKVLAIFCNGLPLGMVWGLVVWYLEGRRTSELLLAGLACSYIVSSGAVKDVGRYLMVDLRVSEAAMPMVTGLLFLPPFLISVWLLSQVPPPTVADRAARVERKTMDGTDRLTFFRALAVGLVLLLLARLLSTAFRDFRDLYGVELFGDLGYHGDPILFTRTELPVAFGVMAALALLNLVRSNRAGVLCAHVMMMAGLALMGVSTLLLDGGLLSGLGWMVLVGLGSYLAYVPHDTVLFDRIIASTGARRHGGVRHLFGRCHRLYRLHRLAVVEGPGLPGCRAIRLLPSLYLFRGPERAGRPGHELSLLLSEASALPGA